MVNKITYKVNQMIIVCCAFVEVGLLFYLPSELGKPAIGEWWMYMPLLVMFIVMFTLIGWNINNDLHKGKLR